MKQAPSVDQGNFADRYIVERELGRGATAVVYLARDRDDGRLVAIKVLRKELAGSISTEQFLREIRLTSELSHPHIVPLLTSGAHDSVPYCVLPFMDGGTLRQRLDREKQLPIADVIAIGTCIGRALAFAHSRNLVHRDVKPENILFTAGRPTLADFGIARALERSADDATTSTGVIRGTPAYMSPEQAGGERDIDGRSDIYSLACVLYEAIGGVPAFVGPTSQAIVSQRLAHMPRPVHIYRPAVPPQLEAALEKALAPVPADRYRTAEEFAVALESADLTQRSQDATGPASWPSAGGERPTPSRPRWIGYAALALLAGLAVMVAVKTGGPGAAVVAGIPEGDQRRIAVLYFDDLTPNSVPGHVADGITEDLIDQLGAVRALHVISPNAVRRFRGRDTPPDSVAHTLKVGTIVTGSIAQSGDTMRVTVRLVDGASGRQITSRPVQARVTDLFTLQDRVADQVAFFLRQRIGDEIAIRQHRAATSSYAAWELVQRASAATHRGVEGGILRGDWSAAAQLYLAADSLYARASQLDPAWALPLIRRGRLALSQPAQSPIPPNPTDSIAYRRATPPERRLLWSRRALEFADDALRRDSQSPDALSLRGAARFALITNGAPHGDSLARLVEQDVRAALAARPDFASAWSILAQLSLRAGRFADAAAAAEDAYQADAFFETPRIAHTGFLASLRAERLADSRRWCRLGLDHYAGDPRFSECELTILGWTGRSAADAGAAWSALTRIEQRDSLHMLDQTRSYRRLMVAAVLARAGMRDSARAVLVSLQAGRSSAGMTEAPPVEESYVRLLLGDRDGALAGLAEQARVAPQSRAQLTNHPWFRPLHGDPRFDALVTPP